MQRLPTPDIMADVLGPARPATIATIAVTAIRTNGGTQMRAGLDENTVNEYHATMQAAGGWGPFPAVTIFHDGHDHWLGDGFHRIAAFRILLVDRPDLDAPLPADIRAGTRRDAVLFAAGANASHGLRRSQADKRRSVAALLRDEEWRAWSDREIARKCNVSADLVGAVRRELYPPAPPPAPPVTVGNDSETPAWVPPGISAPRTFVTKHGTPATMQTAAIGKTPTYAPVWRIEAKVKAEIENAWPNTDASFTNVAQLHRAAQTPGCAFMCAIEAGLDEDDIEYRRQDVVRAITNVANEMEQELKRQVTPVISDNDAAPVRIVADNDLFTLASSATSAMELSHNRIRKPFDYDGLLWTCIGSSYGPQPENNAAACLRLHAPGEAIEPGQRADGYLHSAYLPGTLVTCSGKSYQLGAQWMIVRGVAAPAADETAILTPDRTDDDPLPVSQRDGYDGDEWYTPDEIIRTAAHVMGRIDCDPASCELAQTVVQAGTYYTRHDSGLSQPWNGSVWLNPPYSAPQVWIDRLFAEMDAGRCQQAIVLVNNATETAWFQRLLTDAKLVCFPSRRLAFWRHDHSNVGARQGQALFYFGPKAEVFYRAFSATGAVLRRLR